MKYHYSSQGDPFVLYEHPKRPNGHWRADAQLFYVMETPEEGDKISLHGDVYDMKVVFSYGENRVLEYHLVTGEPDLEDVSPAVDLPKWAAKVCEILDDPPDLWPIGD